MEKKNSLSKILLGTAIFVACVAVVVTAVNYAIEQNDPFANLETKSVDELQKLMNACTSPKVEWYEKAAEIRDIIKQKVG